MHLRFPAPVRVGGTSKAAPQRLLSLTATLSLRLLKRPVTSRMHMVHVHPHRASSHGRPCPLPGPNPLPQPHMPSLPSCLLPASWLAAATAGALLGWAPCRCRQPISAQRRHQVSHLNGGDGRLATLVAHLAASTVKRLRNANAQQRQRTDEQARACRHAREREREMIAPAPWCRKSARQTQPARPCRRPR